MKKPKISAEVSVEEFDSYKAEARHFGMTLSDWMRKALNSSLAHRPEAPAGLNAAFAQLDASETHTVAPVTVVAPPAPPLEKLVQPPLPPSDLHPCVYLNPARPSHLNAGECAGVCGAPSQRGRPCFFFGDAAKSCRVFASRVAPPPPREGTRVRR